MKIYFDEDIFSGCASKAAAKDILALDEVKAIAITVMSRTTPSKQQAHAASAKHAGKWP